jgi:hypothetical protein
MIFWNEEHQIPQHWNFDAHLLDSGWPQPRCAQACPTAALRAVQLSDSELRALIASEKLTVLREDLQTKPRVFYRGLTEALSHRLTGNLVNVSHTGQVSNCSGVELTLFEGAQAPVHAVSNHFGDFEFSDLGCGSSTYRLCISRDGQPDFIKEGARHGSIDLGTLAV